MTDNISKLLRGISFTNWETCGQTHTSSWATSVPGGKGTFLVLRGKPCILQVGENKPILVADGDMVLVRCGVPHFFGDALTSPVTVETPSFRPQPITGDMDQTILIHSSFDLTLQETRADSNLWPATLRRNIRDEGMASTSATIASLIDELASPFPGSGILANQLSHLLCTQFLRTCLTDQNEDSNSGWMSGAADPQIGPTLARLHDEPELPWTVAQMARMTHMSKSAFCERFREVVGRPPLQYLTGFRMNQACEMLRQSDLGVKEIALRVGYETASSFTNAFKRWVGTSPAAFRKAELSKQ